MASADDQPPQTTAYVFNMSEDVWPFITAISDDQARAREIEENANLGDQNLFSLAPEDHVLFISPRPFSPEFLHYYQQLTKTRHLEIAVTEHHSGLICPDILHDQAVMAALVRAANSSHRLTLISYSNTPYFINLVKALRSQGLTIFTPEAPEEEDGWTANFYGSKSGIRQLAQRSAAKEPDLRMADGLICSGITDAAQIAAWTYLEQKGVVLKTNKGHSGSGLLIFRPGDLPSDYTACTQAILDKLQQDAYWDRFPIIIEDFLQANLAIGGGFPSVEFKIWKSGKVEFLYYCGMRIDAQGVFRGVEIHSDVVSDQLAAQMTDTGFFVGEQYAAAGYRGYFDLDFIAGRNGQLYVTESNVRRTGGTHVYNLAVKLFGKDFIYDTYTLTNNAYHLPTNRNFTFPQILTLLQPVLFNPRTREGLIVISENFLRQHILSYLVFAPTRKKALDIEARLDSLITSSTLHQSALETPPGAAPPPTAGH